MDKTKNNNRLKQRQNSRMDNHRDNRPDEQGRYKQ